MLQKRAYMYKTIVVAVMLLLVGCGPRYVIKNQYIPPTHNISPKCLDNCALVRQTCQVQCQQNYQFCLDDAYAKSKAILIQEESAYNVAYSHYMLDFSHFQHQMRSWERDYYDYSRDLSYFQGRCESGKDASACQRRDQLRNHLNYMKRDRPREPWVPQKPSFEQILVNQQSFCTTNCGCEQVYDNCFVGCGGTVIPHKICVENCD